MSNWHLSDRAKAVVAFLIYLVVVNLLAVGFIWLIMSVP